MHEAVDSARKYMIREEEEEKKKKGIDESRKVVSSSSTWLRAKDPRIVRVSGGGLGGGKDRHSKVCTIRGLRDRRVRLSVPTAIQLYDLQSRLGVSQPSKVVDWLLNAAKSDIDQLPPLPFFPSPSHFRSATSTSTSSFINHYAAQQPHHLWAHMKLGYAGTNQEEEEDGDNGASGTTNNNIAYHTSPQVASFQQHQTSSFYLQQAGNNDDNTEFYLGGSGQGRLRFQPINLHDATQPVETLPSVLMSLSSSSQQPNCYHHHQQQQQLGCNRMDEDLEEKAEEVGSSSQPQFADTNFHTLLRLHSTVAAPSSSSSSFTSLL